MRKWLQEKRDFIKSGSTNTEDKTRGYGGKIISDIIKYFGDKDWELVTNLHKWLFVPETGSYRNNGVAIMKNLKKNCNKQVV